jgi:UDP-N-acetylmuramate: L-alanyl-gamma-D-glutamyl-meso-diaminopimelate ligase
LPEEGFLLVNDAYLKLREIATHTKAQMLVYGDKPTSDVRFENIRQEGDFQRFDFIYKGDVIGELATLLSGVQNIANITGAAGLAYAHGLSFMDIQKAVATFEGMKRRQEIIADVNGIIVMDDFAHHPTAVKTTVAGIKMKYPSRRLIAVFEPSTRSSRKKMFESEYIEAFDGADFVCIKMPKLGNGEDATDVLDLGYVTAEIQKRGPQAHAYPEVGTILDDIVPHLKKDDLVLVMSHGEFDKIRPKLIERLKAVQ